MHDRDVLRDCSFHSDGSKMDITNDDVCNHKNERIKKSHEKAKVKAGGKNKGKEKATDNVV